MLSQDDLWPRAGSWPAFDPAVPTAAVVLGVPTWHTSLSPTGAHATPAAVREALQRYSAASYDPRTGDFETSLNVSDAGDVDEPDGDEGVRRTIGRVREISGTGSFVIALGGDNSLTYPVARGAGATGLITIDAHLDLRDGVSNGSPVRRLVQDAPNGERIDPSRIVQIGIADFANSAAYMARAAGWGIRVITLDEFEERGAAAVVAEAVERAGAGGSRIHLDVDVDVVDRAAAPGCPASVPGGMSARQLRQLVRRFGGHRQIVSADIAEVDATSDAADGRTVRLAALCVLELLAGRASPTVE